jgi:hypothetical protein
MHQLTHAEVIIPHFETKTVMDVTFDVHTLWIDSISFHPKQDYSLALGR